MPSPHFSRVRGAHFLPHSSRNFFFLVRYSLPSRSSSGMHILLSIFPLNIGLCLFTRSQNEIENGEDINHIFDVVWRSLGFVFEPPCITLWQSSRELGFRVSSAQYLHSMREWYQIYLSVATFPTVDPAKTHYRRGPATTWLQIQVNIIKSKLRKRVL